MIQVWTMMGLGGVRPDDDPLGKIIELFDGAGYVGVVATNCEQTYHRYLRPGEEVSVTAEITDVVGPKQTGLGEGYFINQKIRWWVGEESVADMDWRILKFIPRAKEAAAPATAVPEDLDPDKLMRPSSSRDSRYFWDGVAAHELRIQRRPDGSLQHPPVPAVWADKDAPVDYVVAKGTGTVFSYVVHHAPKVPGGACRSSSPWWNSTRACGCWASCAASTPRRWRSECPCRQPLSTSPPGRTPSEPAWTLYAWEPVP